MTDVTGRGVLPGLGHRPVVPAPGSVLLYWAAVPAGALDAGRRAGLAADLDEATLRRLERFRRDADRDRGLAGQALLRRVISGALGVPAAGLLLSRRCAHCGSAEHGKPFVNAGGEPPLQVSLSHSGERVLVALAGPGVQVGVDVERPRSVDWSALRRSVFGDAEWLRVQDAADPDAACLAAWTRKEAAVKATGHGLALGLREVAVRGGGVGEGARAGASPDGVTAAGWVADLPVGVVAGVDLVLGQDLGRPDAEVPYAAALAVLGAPGAGDAIPPSVTGYQAALWS